MRKILFFQAADYLDFYDSFEKGEPEKYAYQKQLTDLGPSFLNKYGITDVAVVSLFVSTDYDKVLPNSVRAVGIPFAKLGKKKAQEECRRFVKEYAPDDCIIQIPSADLIRFCSKQKIRSLVMVADSFTGRGLIGFIRCKMLAFALNNPAIEVVTNHNYPSSILLEKYGVDPEKIIPWDFPWDLSVYDFPAKKLDKNKKAWDLFYAGRVIDLKGVGDVIKAAALLKKKGYASKVNIAGSGNIDIFKKQAEELGVLAEVSFLGNIVHEEVINRMHKADAVIVPSWTKASEGMPCTIYESLIARTPLVLSTHPLFKAAIKNGVFFEQRNAESLADRLLFLMANKTLYEQLSQGSIKAVNDLIVPFTFAEVIGRWLSRTEENKSWFKRNCLKNKRTNSKHA